uniref:Uncharacterized protein n=1 Tax=Tetranychus urticae TaxID=32264 RepID=T1KR18_TETUR
MGSKLICVFVFITLIIVSEASIAYFESYGWPSYGIVKPFWMRPFSDHPAAPISGYSRKHFIRSAGLVVGSSLY